MWVLHSALWCVCVYVCVRVCVRACVCVYAVRAAGPIAVTWLRDLPRRPRAGVRLRSGAELPCELLVTATGLNLQKRCPGAPRLQHRPAVSCCVLRILFLARVRAPRAWEQWNLHVYGWTLTPISLPSPCVHVHCCTPGLSLGMSGFRGGWHTTTFSGLDTR